MSPEQITLYGRPGCHLCDDALDALRAIASSNGVFEIREVDIESDDGLMRRFLEKIPVIEVNGEVVSELDSDPAVLRKKLAGSGLMEPVLPRTGLNKPGREGYADK